jgi:hypothetical protein
VAVGVEAAVEDLEEVPIRPTWAFFGFAQHRVAGERI